ncbi:hypothetical protein T439DRAFT_308988 [Meredithblackwellia eburnea MCA 4105]
MSASPKGKEKEVDGHQKQPQEEVGKHAAAAVIVIGMAGSGKTTFMQRVNAHLHAQKTPPYILNLDPAVTHLPFTANIDIRDTVDYQEVMKQYNLGPNGGILTALNLFTTKFDQVLAHVEKRATTVDHIFIDTPGQIEIFTWSASGSIITDALASAVPTVVAYIIDTPRTSSPATFMSNMLYACSILYKSRLPFILVFNKTDVQSHQFALEWMRDFEAFQAALIARRNEGAGEGEGGPGYMDSLMNSMSLVLDEFYKHLRAVGVSAMTGDGMEDFFHAVDEARKEYETDYKPELDKIVADRKRETDAKKADSMARLMRDMKVSGRTTDVLSGSSGISGSESADDKKKRELEEFLRVKEEEEAERDDQDSDEGEIIDRSSRTDYYDLPTKRTRGASGVAGDDGTVWPAP